MSGCQWWCMNPCPVWEHKFGDASFELGKCVWEILEVGSRRMEELNQPRRSLKKKKNIRWTYSLHIDMTDDWCLPEAELVGHEDFYQGSKPEKFLQVCTSSWDHMSRIQLSFNVNPWHIPTGSALHEVETATFLLGRIITQKSDVQAKSIMHHRNFEDGVRKLDPETQSWCRWWWHISSTLSLIGRKEKKSELHTLAKPTHTNPPKK